MIELSFACYWWGCNSEMNPRASAGEILSTEVLFDIGTLVLKSPFLVCFDSTII